MATFACTSGAGRDPLPAALETRAVAGRLWPGSGYTVLALGPESGAHDADTRGEAMGDIARAREGGSAADLAESARARLVSFADYSGAILQLQEAFALRPSIALRNDLAVALLERGRREGRYLDLVEAHDLLADAADADRNDVTGFNRGLVLASLGFRGAAQREWTAASGTAGAIAWIEDARSFMEVEARPDWLAEVDVDAALATDSTALAGAVERYPGAALRFVAGALGRWGETVRDEGPLASNALAAAEAVAESLLRMGADSLSARAVAAVADADGDEVEFLAEGHREYWRALDQLDRRAPGDAMERMERALDRLRHRTPFEEWARVGIGLAAYQTASFARGRTWLSALVEQEGLSRAASARAHWLLGLFHSFGGDPDSAYRAYGISLDAYLAIGDATSSTAVDMLAADELDKLGLPHRAWESRGRALARIGRVQDPYREEAIFHQLSAALGRIGRPDLALQAVDALMETIRATGTPVSQVNALRRRAELLIEAGRGDEAMTTVARARRLLPALPELEHREYAEAYLGWIESRLSVESAPARAIDLLSDVLRYQERVDSRFQLSELYRERARAHRAHNDNDAAAADLGSGVAAFQRVVGELTRTHRQAAYFGLARDVFIEAITHELEFGRADRAWAYAEIGQTAFELGTGTGPLNPLELAADRMAGALPDNLLVLQFAETRGGLVRWRFFRGGVQVESFATDTAELREQVRGIVNELQSTGLSREADSALADLSARFFASGLAGIPSGTPVALVTSGPLSGLPFAALPVGGGARWIERHPILMAPSVSFLADPGVPRSGGSHGAVSALVIGDPAATSSPYGSFPRLPGAAEEAAEIARLYGDRARLLLGEAALREPMLESLAGRAILHFAGHALANDEAPEESALLLGGADAAGRLAAREIYGLSFPALRLVSLAACGTAADTGASADPLRTLAYPFLVAGAEAVVGTLWPIPDAESGTLFVDFHKNLARGLDAPRALQRAQLASLESGTAVSVWAAPVLMGRSVTFGGEDRP